MASSALVGRGGLMDCWGQLTIWVGAVWHPKGRGLWKQELLPEGSQAFMQI